MGFKEIYGGSVLSVFRRINIACRIFYIRQWTSWFLSVLRIHCSPNQLFAFKWWLSYKKLVTSVCCRSTAFELDCDKVLLAFFACHHILEWATFCAGLLIIGCQFVTEKRHQGCHKTWFMILSTYIHPRFLLISWHLWCNIVPLKWTWCIS